MPEKISLDEIMSKRAFSVHKTPAGTEVLTKIHKAPATFSAESRSATFVMTAEVVDRYGDVVVTKGADITEFNNNPVALWAHNSRGFPIGMWDNLKTINGTPKRMEGKVNLSPEGTTEDSDAVFRLLSAGMVRACSIGFMPKSWESIKDDKDRWIGYKFLEWELLECSICSVPANPAAIVKAAGGDVGLALQAIELVLDEWARTPDGLIVPREEYEKAYATTRNKDVTIVEVRSIPEEKPVESPFTLKDGKVEFNPASLDGVIARSMKAFADMFGLKPVEKKVEEPADPAAAPAIDKDLEPVDEEFEARVAKALAEDEPIAEADDAELRRQMDALLQAAE